MWRLHTPKQGTDYHTLLFEQATLSVYTLLSICLPNYLTARIKNKAFQTYLPGTTGMILYPGSYTYLPFPFRNIGSSHKGPQCPTLTGAVATRRTCRYNPAPEYQREDSDLFSKRTAKIFFPL